MRRGKHEKKLQLTHKLLVRQHHVIQLSCRLANRLQLHLNHNTQTPPPRKLNHVTPGNPDTHGIKFQTKLPQFVTPGGPTPSTTVDKFRIELTTPMEIEKNNIIIEHSAPVDKISQEKKKSGETIDDNKQTK